MENWFVRAAWHPLLLLVDGKPGENKQTLSRPWSSSCGCDSMFISFCEKKQVNEGNHLFAVT